MKLHSDPKVAVLLAAYNGEKYIEKQIETIFKQEKISLHIFISIDKSNDATLDVVEALQKKHPNITLLPYGERFGNAGKNFYRLIRESSDETFDFYCFSDQDDLWQKEKIISAIKLLDTKNASCYSSNVIATWLDSGKSRIINKAQPQKAFDYLFEAAGPGCTYVFTAEFFLTFRQFIIKNWETIQLIDLHDWLVYSYARARKIKWLIDPIPRINYIQHQNNLVGVNSGIPAFKKRFAQVYNSSWFEQVRLIYNTTKTEKIDFMEEFNTPKKTTFLKMILKTDKFRRRKIESFALKIFFIINLTKLIK